MHPLTNDLYPLPGTVVQKTKPMICYDLWMTGMASMCIKLNKCIINYGRLSSKRTGTGVNVSSFDRVTSSGFASLSPFFIVAQNSGGGSDGGAVAAAARAAKLRKLLPDEDWVTYPPPFIAFWISSRTDNYTHKKLETGSAN